jgi:hypothetical protein
MNETLFLQQHIHFWVTDRETHWFLVHNINDNMGRYNILYKCICLTYIYIHIYLNIYICLDDFSWSY